MTKNEAIKECEALLRRLPSVWRCVACGLEKPISWSTWEGNDEGPLAVTIAPASGSLRGWCDYGGDRTMQGQGGLHCPACREKRG